MAEDPWLLGVGRVGIIDLQEPIDHRCVLPGGHPSYHGVEPGMEVEPAKPRIEILEEAVWFETLDGLGKLGVVDDSIVEDAVLGEVLLDDILPGAFDEGLSADTDGYGRSFVLGGLPERLGGIVIEGVPLSNLNVNLELRCGREDP